MFKQLPSFSLAISLCIFSLHSADCQPNPCHQFSADGNDEAADFNAAMQKADEFLDSGLYMHAVTLYSDILAASATTGASDQALPRVRLHLTKAYLELEQFANALSAINSNLEASHSGASADDETHLPSLYLAAMAHKGLKQYDQAKELLAAYLRASSNRQLPFHDEARFESGLASFLNKDYAAAEEEWHALSPPPSKPRLVALKHIYLARTALALGQPANAAAQLTAKPLMEAEKGMAPDDVLHYELSYVKGETAFQQRDYTGAARHFESALPTRRPDKCAWQPETLYRLGWCYFKMGEDKNAPAERQAHYIAMAEERFRSLLAVAPEDRVYLALGQCYLTRGNLLHDESGYAQAETLLSQQDLFVSREAKAQALLLRAEAAPSYAARERLYRQLTQGVNRDSAFYGQGCYLRAWNEFDEGQRLFRQGQREKALALLEKAATAFARAHDYLKGADIARAASAVKYRAIAIGYKDTPEANKAALGLLDTLAQETTPLEELFDTPDEIHYLHGFYASRLAKQESADKDRYTALAEQSLQRAAAVGQNNTFGDTALCHLGAFYYQEGRYAQAEAAYLQLIDSFPRSPLAGEALFWAARCADEQGQSALGKERRHRVFSDFPASPYAAEACFTVYSPQEYLQGNRQAIKHLQMFIENYQDTPLLLQAYYWLGLDHQRDRKTDEGKWLRKKNLTEAINAFYQVERLFDRWADAGEIPEEKRRYYVAMRYRAQLKRAQANLAIADESQGAKQQIYLEYARDLFKELADKFSVADDPHVELLSQGETLPSLLEEASLYLAQTLVKEGDDQAAEDRLAQMNKRYSEAKITRGYYLSRGLYELGSISMRRGDYPAALTYFKQAQDTAKGNVLATDQRLDLFIQESMCYRGLQQWDDAILVLSKVVNDDAVSSLRLKAMYLRAEVYALQGRPELARKQLDSMVNKGGPWAAKAKETLETDYGY